jgi:hypothetical protein
MNMFGGEIMSSGFRFITPIICAIMLAIASRASGQTRIALTAGLIENLQDASNQPQYSFYPEIQLLNDFFALSEAKVTVGGSLYWGYWTDGVDELSSCKDCFTFSYSSHIIGARVMAALDAFPIPIAGFAGISRHFIRADYIGGYDYPGNPGSDFQDALNAFEAGIRVQVPMSQRLHIGGNYRQYTPFVKKNSRYDSRAALGIGLTYMF